MAKRGRSTSTLNQASPSRAPVAVVVRRPIVVPRGLPPTLTLIEDRRRFHPLGRNAPAAVVGGRLARRIEERQPGSGRVNPDPFPSLRLGFSVPAEVVHCIRRKTRREVMFAKRQTGKGSRSKVRKHGPFSKIGC